MREEKFNLSEVFPYWINEVCLGNYPIRHEPFPYVQPGEIVMGKLQLDRSRAMYSLFMDMNEMYRLGQIPQDKIELFVVNINLAHSLWWQDAQCELDHGNLNCKDVLILEVRKGWRVVII